MSETTLTSDEKLGASSFKSVPDMWHHRIESTPDSEAISFRDNGDWVKRTWSELGVRTRNISNGLLSRKLKAEQRVCILSSTRPEWVMTDIGILCAGGATTTIYPSNTPEECEYIIKDCGAVAIFCDTDEQVAKLQEVRKKIKKIKTVIVFDGKSSEDGWVISLADLEAEGLAFAEEKPDDYEKARKAITPDRLATLMYTSGTTGKPKGVMLTHDAWIYEAEAVDAMGILTPADRQFLFLPLSHVFAKVMGVAFIRLGIPTVVDGNVDALLANLGETRPTWMGAVPRIFEKAYTKIVMQARDAGGMKLKVFNWAVAVGSEVSRVRQSGQEPSAMLKVKFGMADKLVFSKVKAKFGGRLRFFLSGGAPLAKEIAEFFHACDIMILEGYGLTESSAASSCTRLTDFEFGTVGKPVPGCEIKIAEDGEILIKSRGVMKGYYNQEDATKEAITEDGWLKTGDIGVITSKGNLKITDRKKELIITAGGKNIAPAHFQNLLKVKSPYVSQVLMHGDKRPFCVALVTINDETVGNWAKKKDISFTDYADLASKEQVKELIMSTVSEINSGLPSYETIKKIQIYTKQLTQENGALTPSLKVKRKVVESQYKEVLDDFYADTAAPKI